MTRIDSENWLEQCTSDKGRGYRNPEDTVVGSTVVVGTIADSWHWVCNRHLVVDTRVVEGSDKKLMMELIARSTVGYGSEGVR